jgi:hypothetical protein
MILPSRLLSLAGAVVAAAMTSAQAQEPPGGRTVQNLYHDCTGSPQAQVSCIRFLGGVGSTMMMLGDLADADGLARGARPALAAVGACPRAEGISGGEMRANFIRWADSHPDASFQPETLGAMRALRAGWPCK